MIYGKTHHAPDAIIENSDTKDIGPLNIDGTLLLPTENMQLAYVKHEGRNVPMLQLRIGRMGLYAPLSMDQIDNMITAMTATKHDLMNDVAGEASAAIKKAGEQ